MIITAILPQKKRPNRSSVYIDSVFSFGIGNEDLTGLKLTEGATITQEELKNIINHTVFIKARDTALRYLSARPRSFYEMEKRLNEDEYPPEIIARVMKILIRYNYINDRKFSAEYAASRLRIGAYGPYRIRQELKNKGIADEIIEQAVKAPDYDEVTAIKNWLKRKCYDPLTADKNQKRRFTDALIRCGFTFSAIKDAMKEENFYE
jgi:regulatory protein